MHSQSPSPKRQEIKKISLEEKQTEVPIEIEENLNIPLDQILSSIQNLPTQYRLTFNLYVMDEYSHKEISEMLSISIGTSKSNLHRAKLILKEQIQVLKKEK